MTTVNEQLDSLTVAAQHLVEAFGDLRTRGRITEHPAFIEHSAGLIEAMLVEIGRGIVEAKCTTRLPELHEGEVEQRHRVEVAQYASHACDCSWCLHAQSEGDAGEPIPTGITLTAEQVAAFHARRTS